MSLVIYSGRIACNDERTIKINKLCNFMLFSLSICNWVPEVETFLWQTCCRQTLLINSPTSLMLELNFKIELVHQGEAKLDSLLILCNWFQVETIRVVLKKELDLPIIEISDPTAKLDGGDVLFTGNFLFSISFHVKVIKPPQNTSFISRILFALQILH